jgi:anti-sigma B factor antagonist
MTIQTENYGQYKILRVIGKIDILTSSEVRAKLAEVSRAKVNMLIVDLEKVAYMDSSGLATFLEGLKSMKEYGGILRLANVPERIGKVLNLMRLDKVFEIYKDIEEAVKGR